jgi:hypothetical protein
MIGNNELENLWKEETVTSFKTILSYITEETQENPQSA